MKGVLRISALSVGAVVILFGDLRSDNLKGLETLSVDFVDVKNHIQDDKRDGAILKIFDLVGVFDDLFLKGGLLVLFL